MKDEQEESTMICPWCDEPILEDQPKGISDADGSIMHFVCACQEGDADIGDCSSN